MRARRPTSAMPKSFLCCERAFPRNVGSDLREIKFHVYPAIRRVKEASDSNSATQWVLKQLRHWIACWQPNCKSHGKLANAFQEDCKDPTKQPVSGEATLHDKSAAIARLKQWKRLVNSDIGVVYYSAPCLRVRLCSYLTYRPCHMQQKWLSDKTIQEAYNKNEMIHMRHMQTLFRDALSLQLWELHVKWSK